MLKKLLTFISFLLVLLLIESQDLNFTNSTELASNETNITNTTEPTTEEPLTTPISPTESPEDQPFRHYIHYNDEYCICDLRVNWCDINCCCDNDCSESEKSSFGECIETRKQIYDSRYCKNQNIVYINNTETKVEVTSNGLFCIVWDNTGERHLFDDPKPITDPNKLFKITAQHNYKWNLKNIRRDVKSIESQTSKQNWKMKSGKSILISRESNESQVESRWQLSSAGVTKVVANCNTFSEVQYLIDFHSSCYRLVRNVSQHCLKNEYLNPNYYKSFSFVSKNFSNQSDTKKVYINITSESEIKSPFYDSKNKICRKVVQSVHYILRHNGSNGILEAEVTLGTIDLKDTTKWVKQSFEVTFLWYNKSSGLELSGNPGYIVGKPILAAFQTKDMNFSRSATGYEILAQSNGFCDNIIKKSIEFGINWRSGCLLWISNTNEDNLCESIQRTIWKVLEPKNHIDMIGVFGNSSVEITSDWIRILDLDNTSIDSLSEDNCSNIVTGVSLNLYYVMTGTTVQPQHKIVGAVKKFRTQNDVRVKCLTNSIECEDLFVELSSSVTFLDITRPARPDYAPPVTFKIQLPADFFYPFLTSDSCGIEKNKIFFFVYFLVYSLTKYHIISIS